MGLDMYLHAKTYVSGYEHNQQPEKDRYQQILGATGLESLASVDSPSLEVEVTVAYWRKANQIHNWFVKNVQDAMDDCGTYYVSPEKLQELLDLAKTCLRIYDSGERIALNELLPTATGFFFGSTDYDDWYRRDLEKTVEQIERVLEFTNNDTSLVSIYYHSSW